MNHYEITDHLKKLDYLIRSKVTGNADELAEKTGVKRTTIFDRFKDLKGMGAKIKYDRKIQSYIYEEAFKLKF